MKFTQATLHAPLQSSSKKQDNKYRSETKIGSSV
jgi:hypothetical protein